MTSTLDAPAVSLDREELANALTHGVGLLFSLIAAPFLVFAATTRGDALAIVGFSIFALSLVLLYGASTAYHLARTPQSKNWMQIVDHSCIFLLIAGSYTPFALVTLRGPWGWSFLAAAWTMALCGIVFKLFFTGRFPMLSNLLYLGMGWMAVIGWEPMTQNLPTGGFEWLILGGLCYTLGVTFFIFDEKVPFFHAVWHLFVLAGSAAHVVAVYQYVLPANAA